MRRNFSFLYKIWTIYWVYRSLCRFVPNLRGEKSVWRKNDKYDLVEHQLLTSCVGDELFEKKPDEEPLLWGSSWPFVSSSFLTFLITSIGSLFPFECPFVKIEDLPKLSAVPFSPLESPFTPTSILSLVNWVFSDFTLSWFPFSTTFPFSLEAKIFPFSLEAKIFPFSVEVGSTLSWRAVLTPPLLKTTFVSFAWCSWWFPCGCGCWCLAWWLFVWSFFWGLFSSVLMLL